MCSKNDGIALELIVFIHALAHTLSKL
jgi:hypothetical protein